MQSKRPLYIKIDQAILNELSIKKEILFYENKICVGKLTSNEEVVTFDGYKRDIYLNFTTKFTTPYLFLTNSNHKLKVALNAENEHMLINCFAASCHLLGAISSKDNIKLYIHGKVLLDENLKLTANSTIEIYGEGIECASKINSNKEITIINKQGSLILEGNSECLSPRNEIFTSLLKIEGKLVADTLDWDATDIYLSRGASVIVKKNHQVSATNLMVSPHAIFHSTESGKIKLKGTAIIEKDSTLSANAILNIEAKKIKIYGKVIANIANIHIDNKVTIYKKALVKTTTQLQITGGSIYNAGLIDFGQRFIYSLNGIFAFGITKPADLFRLIDSFDDLFERPRIKGKDMNGVALAKLGILCETDARNINECTIGAGEFLSFTQRINSRKANIISISFAIDIPNISVILDDIEIFFKRLSNGQFTTILEELFTLQTIISILSAIRIIIKEALPGISKPIDIVWGIFMLFVNIKPFIEHCILLLNQTREIELRDVIPIVQFCNSFATQAASLEMQVESLVEGPSPSLDFHSLNVEEVLTPLATLVVPVSTQDSVLSAHGGVNINGVAVRHSVVDLSAIEANVERSGINTSFYSAENHVFNAANDISYDTTTLNQQHTYTVANHITTTASEISMTDTNFNAANTSINTHNLNVVDANWSGDKISINAHDANFSGNIKPKDLSLNIEEFNDTNQLLHNKDNYQEVKPEKTLEINTKQPVQLEKFDQNYSVSITTPSIEIKDDLATNGSINLTQTEGDINLTHKIASKENIALNAPNGNIETKQNLKSNNNIYINAGENYHNQATIEANEIAVTANNITNNAMLLADNYLSLSASNNIYNVCVETDVYGVYDWMKSWRAAHMYGGLGLNHHGVGIDIHAGNQFINDASVVESQGDMQISANNGIRITARSHAYVSYHSVHRTWYGKKSEKTVTSLQIAQPYMISHAGKMTLLSEHGTIYSLSTNFLSQQGNFLYGSDGVILQGIIGDQHYEKNSSSWFGLEHHKMERDDEISSPTTIKSLADTTIVSNLGDVKLTNTTIETDSLTVAGKNIVISTPILNHTIIEEDSSFGFNVPLYSQFLEFSQGKFSSLYPLTKDFKGNVADEKKYVDVFAELNRLTTLTRLGNFTPTSLLSIQPMNVTFNYNKSKMTEHYQNVAPNFIHAGQIKLEAQNTITIENGIPVIADGNIDIQAHKLIQSGATLNFSLENDSKEVSLTGGVSPPSIGFNSSSTKIDSTTHVTQVLKAKSANITVDEWELNNAKVEVESIVEDVKHKKVFNEADSYHFYQEHFGVNSKGHISVGSVESHNGITNSHGVDIDLTLFKEVKDNINWLIDQFKKSSHLPIVEEWGEEKSEKTNNHGKASQANKHHPSNKQHHKSSSHPKSKGHTNKNSRLLNHDNDDEQTNSGEVGNQLEAEQIHTVAEFLSKMCMAFTKSSLKKYGGHLPVAVNVYNFCNAYQNSLDQGKSQEEALWDASFEVLKYLAPSVSIEVGLAYLEAEILGLPMALVETTHVVSNINKERVNRMYDQGEKSWNANNNNSNNNSNTNSRTPLTFWDQAVRNWVKHDIDQKRQEFNTIWVSDSAKSESEKDQTKPKY